MQRKLVGNLEAEGTLYLNMVLSYTLYSMASWHAVVDGNIIIPLGATAFRENTPTNHLHSNLYVTYAISLYVTERVL